MNVYKAVLLDLDGVVWTRYGAIDKSPDATHLFKENGIKVFYLTNNSHRSQQETFDKLVSYGFYVESLANIVTSPFLTYKQLEYDGVKGKVLALGSKTLLVELQKNPDLQLVSFVDLQMNQVQIKHTLNDQIAAIALGYKSNLSYYETAVVLSIATINKCKIYLTNQDVFYPAGNEIMPGTGSYLSCITMPHEILNDKIVVCGKPNVLISEHLKKMFALEKTEVVMVGDNLETDVKLGINCGYRSVLVETGVHSRADVEKLKIKPSKIFKSLYDMACNVNNEREQVNY